MVMVVMYGKRSSTLQVTKILDSDKVQRTRCLSFDDNLQLYWFSIAKVVHLMSVVEVLDRKRMFMACNNNEYIAS